MNAIGIPLALAAALGTGLLTTVVVLSLLVLRRWFIELANRPSNRR